MMGINKTRVLTVALLGLSLAGCSNLRDISPDVCGNLALDVAEDCDGSSPFAETTACGAPGTANACFLICDSESEAVCPDGWGCGVDGRCRRPAGTFVQGPSSPWRFPVDSFGVGDVDGDGFADLIGNDTTTITVRYGDATGSFASELDVFTREPTGPLAFADINADGRLDVLVPIESGLSTLLGTADRDLDPVAYPQFGVGGVDVRIVPVPSDELVNVASPLMLLDGTDDTMRFDDDTKVPLPAGFAVTQLAGRVPVALLDSDTPVVGDGSGSIVQGGRHSFALAFRGDTSVWIYSSIGDQNPMTAGPDLQPLLTHNIDLPPGTIVGPGGVHFADVNGDGAIDLVVNAARPSQPDGIAVAFDTGTGAGETLEAVAQPFNVQVPMGGPTAPFPYAMADLSGDDQADFITAKGIFVTSAGSLVLQGGAVLHVVNSATTGPWTTGATGDFNGDGFMDAASASDEVDALFVYIGSGTGIFNRFIVATDLPPTSLRSGDYDGDLIADIAFVESDPDTPNEDRVSVSFGSSTGSTSPPVFMGEFGSVESIEPALVPTTAGIDLVFDLLVVSAFEDSSGEVESRSFAILEGSSTRRMVSPVLLLSNDATVVPVSVVAGSFSEAGAVGDVIVVARNEPADEDEVRPDTLYLLKGIGTGQYDPLARSVVALEGNSAFDASCALWVSGDLDCKSDGPISTGTDEIIAFDNAVGCRSQGGGSYSSPSIAIAEATPGGIVPISVEVIPSEEGDFRVVSDVDLFDADMDGDLDMVVLFRGQFSLNQGSINEPEGDGIVVYWHENGEIANWSALDGADVGVRSVAPILFDGDDGVPELVVLGRDAIYLSHLDPDTRVFSALVPIRDSIGYERFEAGDLNGDGLTDIALTFDGKVEILLSEPAPTRGQELADLDAEVAPLLEPAPPANGGGQ